MSKPYYIDITVPLGILLVKRWAFSCSLYRMTWRMWSRRIVDNIFTESPLLKILKMKGKKDGKWKKVQGLAYQLL